MCFSAIPAFAALISIHFTVNGDILFIYVQALYIKHASDEQNLVLPEFCYGSRQISTKDGGKDEV